MFCAVACILRMHGSSMVLCVCIVCVGKGSVLGNSPEYKENSAQFFLENVK